MKITVPTSWEDITVNQYQMLNTLERDKYKTDMLYTIALIDILCGIDSKKLPIHSFNEIALLISFLTLELKPIRKETITVEGEVFHWVADFGSISVGEMISVEQIIDMEELTYNLSVDVIAAVLLRKEGEDFDAKEFTKRRDLFGELPITELLGMVNFFSNGGRHSILNTKDCLITPKITKGTKAKRVRQILWGITNGFQWLINLQSRTLLIWKMYINKTTLVH